MTQTMQDKKNSLTLILSQDRMGHGDDVLGSILIKKFLKTFGDIAPVPSYVLLYNSGVKLATEGSEVLGELKVLESKGATVLNCGTCLDHFNSKDQLRVGSVSTMHEIVGIMAGTARTVQI
ncbi:MAG: sulfurtransferase-like selenium metabolism protein YedF [Fibrobacteres bacterium]|nr:sulfurtransferase-like selenium metabolism protein YedF [Fibrobacterota bacterium]